ncbi:MAG TPA: type II toxin-antitoxin system HicB family antitoxin [Thermoanaerobaculia bacterium]|nr:type II toxin-antitoxin system HicB family antitoxin [Thermoanaerobaculia bacterium]
MKYKVVLERSEEGVAASVPGLPGCWSQGESEAEALDNIRWAIAEYLEVVNELTRDAEVREVEVVV